MKRLTLKSEVALDLGCERCARVYLAIVKKDASSLEEIVQNIEMAPRTVKRHLDRLLALGLVAHTISGYKIVRKLDSVKKMTCKGSLYKK